MTTHTPILKQTVKTCATNISLNKLLQCILTLSNQNKKTPQCRNNGSNTIITRWFFFYKATLIKADFIKDQLSTMKYTDYIPLGFQNRGSPCYYWARGRHRVPLLIKTERKKITLLSTGVVILFSVQHWLVIWDPGTDSNLQRGHTHVKSMVHVKVKGMVREESHARINPGVHP